MASFENLRVADVGAIRRIVVDRAKVMNALNRATIQELERAIDAIDATQSRVVVITGGGEKAFVAGADIQEMEKLSVEDALAFSRHGQQVFRKLEALDAVVIAEVNGYAMGGGCELMLACDFAIASDNAKFGQPEVKLGVTPGFGGTARLQRRIGNAMARQLLLTGETIDANRALELRLVNEVVPPGELRSRVDAMAAQIVKNGPRAVAMVKRTCHLAENVDLDIAMQAEQQAFAISFSTNDQKEGMAAFLQKRPPKWSGR